MRQVQSRPRWRRAAASAEPGFARREPRIVSVSSALKEWLVGEPGFSHVGPDLDAEPLPLAADLDGAAVTGAVAARHRGLPRELRGWSVLAHRLEHGLGPARQHVVSVRHGVRHAAPGRPRPRRSARAPPPPRATRCGSPAAPAALRAAPTGRGRERRRSRRPRAAGAACRAESRGRAGRRRATGLPGPRPRSLPSRARSGRRGTPSSPGGARQSENGRGSSLPGASSMKNCPGSPGSSPPRSTRTSVYGPTPSTPTTLRCSRLKRSFP